MQHDLLLLFTSSFLRLEMRLCLFIMRSPLEVRSGAVQLKQSYWIIGLRGGEPGRRKLSTMVGKSKSDAIFSARKILFPKRASMKRRL
jgi:hypothetical protein